MVSDRSRPFDDLATEVDLHHIASEWREVDRDRAAEVLMHVLHREMAHQVEVMPLNRANLLAQALIAHYGGRARFATNTEDLAGRSVWFPATDATLDCGPLIIGDHARAVYWVEDEG